jgi:hypothetical protein
MPREDGWGLGAIGGVSAGDVAAHAHTAAQESSELGARDLAPQRTRSRGRRGDRPCQRSCTYRRHNAAAVATCTQVSAVVLGQAAMHQLGWRTSRQSRGRLVTRNPCAHDRQPANLPVPGAFGEDVRAGLAAGSAAPAGRSKLPGAHASRLGASGHSRLRLSHCRPRGRSLPWMPDNVTINGRFLCVFNLLDSAGRALRRRARPRERHSADTCKPLRSQGIDPAPVCVRIIWRPRANQWPVSATHRRRPSGGHT